MGVRSDGQTYGGRKAQTARRRDDTDCNRAGDSEASWVRSKLINGKTKKFSLREYLQYCNYSSLCQKCGSLWPKSSALCSLVFSWQRKTCSFSSDRSLLKEPHRRRSGARDLVPDLRTPLAGLFLLWSTACWDTPAFQTVFRFLKREMSKPEGKTGFS